MNSRAVITLVGVVQGVGFRPALYKYLWQFPVTGEIRNFGSLGVRVVLEAGRDVLEIIVNGLARAVPPMAYVESTDVQWRAATGEFANLHIGSSATAAGWTIVLPPDIATCPACLQEMRNPGNARYNRYPFIACVECGPRFTVMDQLPYDRERSTMVQFPLCSQCQQEYGEPTYRRFHAQTFACATCGPHYSAYAKGSQALEPVEAGDIPRWMAGVIREGHVLAVKGIGGVHLVCRADVEEVVQKLRVRKKRRKYKPFAVMARDLDHVHTFAEIPDKVVPLLASFRRPIVLLPKKHPCLLAPQVAPGLDTVGVLLPYMGLHHLLFDEDLPPLVFTSGNVSNLPMALDNDAIFRQLGSLADFFVLHDRRIAQRCDDSVVKLVGTVPKIIRRSRGYVPEYVPLPFPCDAVNGIAFGPELHNTGAVQKLSRIFPTQHIGNVTNLETYDFLNDAITHLLQLLGTAKAELSTIACDLHPSFHSSRLAREWARELKLEVVPVQHHHAHHAALLADNRVPLDESTVTIAVDGVGYGTDGAPWGGEILVGSYASVERWGHLMPVAMPGGDLAVKYPARMLLGFLSQALPAEDLSRISLARPAEKLFPKGAQELAIIAHQFNSPANIPRSSSLGRVLDALAAGFGICARRTYDGEPAMRLEAFANNASKDTPLFKFEIPVFRENGTLVIDTPALFRWLVEEHAFTARRAVRQRYAFSCQYSIARALAQVAFDVGTAASAKRIGVTGGVALNEMINLEIKRLAVAAGFQFLEHKRVPPGDAGVSVGQLAVASAKWSDSRK